VNFSAIPPEVISALIHAGPGSASMLEAADAWQRLGADLQSTAGSYASVVSSLMDTWAGPSAQAMAQAVEPYLAWMRSTAQQARHAAASAQAAAGAFDTVRSTVIPTAEVAANRTLLSKLLATNIFGINLPAIAQTEDLYQGMWATNSAAMTRYLAASARATTLPQFSSAPSVVGPTGLAAQIPAAAAAATPAATPLDSLLSALQGFDPNKGLSGFLNTYANQAIAGGLPINLLAYLAQNKAAETLQGVGETGLGLSQAGGAPGGLGAAFGAAGLSAEPTAAIGAGVSAGNLTLPPASVSMLAGSHSPVRLASAVSPLPAEESAMDFMPPMMAPPVSAGSGWRERRRQKVGPYEDGEPEEEAEEYQEPEHPAERLNLSAQDTPGSGWVKRDKNYDDIEYGAELRGTVIKKPPSAG
jgi:PPE-repeat protein